WTPASSAATVPEPAGRVCAFSDSSANSSSKVFMISLVVRQACGSSLVCVTDQPAHGPRVLGASRHLCLPVRSHDSPAIGRDPGGMAGVGAARNARCPVQAAESAL